MAVENGRSVMVTAHHLKVGDTIRLNGEVYEILERGTLPYWKPGISFIKGNGKANKELVMYAEFGNDSKVQYEKLL
jgi:hypothetical protein